jgi:hypothetical protein
MTSSTDTLTPDLDFETGLQELISRGYQFVHPRDENGEVLEIVGIRMHDNVVDVVRLSAEDDVTAMRVSGNEENILNPRKVLWRSSGPVASVLAETLALPEDRTPGSLLTPGTDWFPASA